MKLVSTIFVLILLVSGARAQGGVAGEMQVKYDKFEDRTDVDSRWVVSASGIFWLFAQFEGDRCTERPTKTRFFYMIPQGSWPGFGTLPPVKVLVNDNDRFEFDAQKANRLPGTTFMDVRFETFALDAPMSQIEKMANAKSLSIKIGSKGSDLVAAQIAAVKEFVSTIDAKCARK